jgi:hypothetical protein
VRAIIVATLLALAGCGKQDESVEVMRLRGEVTALRAQLTTCQVAARAAPPAVLQANAAGAPAAAQPAAPVPVMAADAGPPPVAVTRTIMSRNSIGEPVMGLEIRSLSDKTIDAVEFRAEVFDNFNEPARGRWREDNLILANSDQSIRPRQTRRIGYWTLHNNESATKGIATISRVHFTDGTEWR